ncbi:MAG: magnesium/cobalt efflux protein, partial [Anaerolineae bacterium]|nr:magnesium/cobalt efflux protein [Anaerolineae bacterium]
MANSLLRLIRVDPAAAATHSLTQEELRTVVNEAGALIPKRHQAMLLSIMDLEKVTVEDIMVPRTEIIGIDLNDNLDDIAKQLGTSLYTRLPTYRDSIDEVTGILHVRKSQYLLRQEEFSHEQLQATLT